MTLSLLIGLLLKSSLIAAGGLAVAHGVAMRPTDRVLVLRATLILLLVLPVAMTILPALVLHVLPASQAASGPVEPLWSGTTVAVAGVALSGDLRWPSAIVVVGWVWAVGALIITARVAAGIWTLAGWTRQAQVVRCPDWTAALTRLGGRHPPRLSASPRVAGPLSWGLSPGAILIDRTSLSAPDTAAAILSHELAHLRRRDWLFLMLSRLALALFWFNPLVWKVAADLASASEDAADAEAVRHVDRHTYARTLIGLAAVPNSPVALAMAADPRSLKRRIKRLMTASRTPRRPLAIGLSIAALVVVATPLAALELHDRAPTAPLPPVPPVAVSAPPAAPIAGLPAMLQMAAPPAPPAPPEPQDGIAPPAVPA
ncbi:M56 family metallopeptidase, partial [Brevundimonas sp.]|uniref:M56 family metallopeptidase n=1 Tax=Brevundimonas sp. TaxID=1871086 RepID=UPI001A1E8262